jgi:hypothetical protein
MRGRGSAVRLGGQSGSADSHVKRVKTLSHLGESMVLNVTLDFNVGRGG